MRSEQAIALAYGHLGARNTISVPAENQRAGAIAWGWWAHIVRTAEAVRRMEGEGFQHETPPLRRSIMDHTMSLVWLRRAPQEVVAAYEYHHNTKQKTLVDKAKADGWDLTGTIEPVVQTGPRPTNLGFVTRTSDLADHLGLATTYVAFMYDTAVVHPTLLGANRYFAFQDETWGPISVPRIPAVGLKPTATFVVQATQAIGELLNDAELLALAGQMANLVGVGLGPAEP